MKRISLFCLMLCIGSLSKNMAQTHFFQSVSIDTVLKGKISIRAILIDGSTVWYAADQGRFGTYNLDGHQKFENQIKKDSSTIEFRSIAKTQDHIFMLSIGNPALLYRVSKKGKQTNLVYQENHEKVFYDSMQFWNDKEGIANW